jgi:hypothetical protein
MMGELPWFISGHLTPVQVLAGRGPRVAASSAGERGMSKVDLSTKNGAGVRARAAHGQGVELEPTAQEAGTQLRLSRGDTWRATVTAGVRGGCAGKSGWRRTGAGERHIMAAIVACPNTLKSASATLNRPELVEARLVGSCLCEDLLVRVVVDHAVCPVVGLELGWWDVSDLAVRRRWLYQSAQVATASSTSSMPRHPAPRRTGVADALGLEQ